MFFSEVRFQEATWAKVDSIWAPKRLQKGSNRETKNEPRRRKDERKIKNSGRALGSFRGEKEK